MGSRPRDTQRARLYRAEDAVPRGRELATVDAMQGFVDAVVASVSWQRVPDAPRSIVVRDGRGRRGACAEGCWHGAVLRIPRWARCERILLHELAHAATPNECAPHGPEFAGRYLALVRRFVSESLWEELRGLFITHRVAFTHSDGVESESRRKGIRSADPRRVLRLVRDLQALARGSDSPAESANAAAKAQHLLLKHNLTAADVDGLESGADPLVEESQPFEGVRSRVPAWKQMLVQAVARASLCEWMTSFTHERQPRSYSFIGRRSNVEVACYLFRCLERQVAEQWDIERRSLRRFPSRQEHQGVTSPRRCLPASRSAVRRLTHRA